MNDSPDPTAVPSVIDLAKVARTLGATARNYLPMNSAQGDRFSKAAMAAAVAARAAKIALRTQRDLEAVGAVQEVAVLNRLAITAMEEGDARVEAVPLVWHWQAGGIARGLRDLREQAPEVDPLLAAVADTARALVCLIEARLNLGTAPADQLSSTVAEAGERLAAARSSVSQVPRWLRQSDNLG